MMWKSTSSSGWEYFIVCADLGSSPMCATWMLFNFCILFNEILNAWHDDKFLKL